MQEDKAKKIKIKIDVMYIINSADALFPPFAQSEVRRLIPHSCWCDTYRGRAEIFSLA